MADSKWKVADTLLTLIETNQSLLSSFIHKYNKHNNLRAASLLMCLPIMMMITDIFLESENSFVWKKEQNKVRKFSWACNQGTKFMYVSKTFDFLTHFSESRIEWLCYGRMALKLCNAHEYYPISCKLWILVLTVHISRFPSTTVIREINSTVAFSKNIVMRISSLSVT